MPVPGKNGSVSFMCRDNMGTSYIVPVSPPADLSVNEAIPVAQVEKDWVTSYFCIH